jgi:suppressor of G2 allele of SKP1
MDSFHEGNQSYVNEDFENSFKSYTKAISEASEGTFEATPFLFAARAAAALKIGKFEVCIEDCNKAIALDSSFERAYLRKAQACFELEEFETAQAALNLGISIQKASEKDTTVYTRLLRKCELEIAESDEAEKAPSPGSSQVAAGKVAPAAKAIAPSAPPVSAKSHPREQAVVPITGSIRYQYFQNDKTLSISVLAKNVDPKDANIELNELHIKVLHCPFILIFLQCTLYLFFVTDFGFLEHTPCDI